MQSALSCVSSLRRLIRADRCAEYASRRPLLDTTPLKSLNVIAYRPYLILVLSAYTLTPSHSLVLTYGAGTYNRDPTVCQRSAGIAPGYGAGYCSWILNRGVLAVLIGKITQGSLQCWRLSGVKRGQCDDREQAKYHRGIRGRI